MTSDSSIDGAEIKSSDNEPESFTPRLCDRYQFNLETKWVDYLQEKLDYCNRNFFKNFKLQLVMVQDKDEFDI